MQYLIFPMKTISISQRFHEKHKALDLSGEDTGIDYWYAPCRVKVLAMFEVKKTGFYNTVLFGSCDEKGNPERVMCADGEARYLTFGCTHMDSMNRFGLAVGKIYESGEPCYCEGNTGLGSKGNHVHMDVAEGWHKKKIKYDDQWLLPNLVAVENLFFKLKGWNKIRNLNGYEFAEVDSREYEEKDMGFVKGYQKLNWLGYKVHIYLQLDNQKIGLMSAKQTGVENWKAVQTIIAIDNDLVHYAKINAGFFDLNSKDHYGVEQSFENDFKPEQEGYHVLYIDKNNVPHHVNSTNYWLSKNDVTLAITPKAVLRHNGEDCEILSTAYKPNLNQKTENTLLLYMGEGKYAFMVTEGDLTLYQCRNFAKNYGAVGIYALDGGGSSQMRANGKSIVYTGRKIPNVLTFYTGSLATEEPEEPAEETKESEVSVVKPDESAEVEELKKQVEELQGKLNKVKEIVNG